VFKYEKGDNVALHLIKFHMHIRKLKVELHEDCLMKMFMATLEGKERSWYEKLPPTSIYSLKDFHIVFFEHFKESYPSLLLVQNCCDHFKNFIQNLENVYEDDVFMDDEIIEAFHENPFHYHGEKVEYNCHDIQQNFQQNIVPFLIVDNEIDQGLSILSHIPAPEIDEHVKQNCQILSDQDLSSDHAYSEISFQEASYQNKSVKIVYMETLRSQP